MRIPRRSFLKAGIMTTAAISMPWSLRFPKAFAGITGGSLDPADINKYQMPLVIPPAMPQAGGGGDIDYYEIAVRQFQQQILPAPHPMTIV